MLYLYVWWFYIYNICVILLLKDINECVCGIDDCSMNVVCSNIDGSFICICNSGFFGDGWICIGI